MDQQDLENNIDCELYFTAANAARGMNLPVHPAHELITFCVLVLRNGYTVYGVSICRDISKFDAEISKKLSREDADNQVFALMDYALRSYQLCLK